MPAAGDPDDATRAAGSRSRTSLPARAVLAAAKRIARAPVAAARVISVAPAAAAMSIMAQNRLSAGAGNCSRPGISSPAVSRPKKASIDARRGSERLTASSILLRSRCWRQERLIGHLPVQALARLRRPACPAATWQTAAWARHCRRRFGRSLKIGAVVCSFPATSARQEGPQGGFEGPGGALRPLAAVRSPGTGQVINRWPWCRKDRLRGGG